MGSLKLHSQIFTLASRRQRKDSDLINNSLTQLYKQKQKQPPHTPIKQILHNTTNYTILTVFKIPNETSSLWRFVAYVQSFSSFDVSV